jgi:SAM-dependent methyltransferase
MCTQPSLMEGICPLCGTPGGSSSWLGSTFYDDQQFTYVQCPKCGTLYCDPMPNEITLGRMYGTDYVKAFSRDAQIDDPKEPGRLLDYLARTAPGVFLDYGCGVGNLLTGALERGWQAIGIEFDPAVASEVERKTGARVVSYAEQESLDPPIADIIHLGDVLEHLTDLNQQMPTILRLVRPGGLLIAQGPLENNGNLFLWAMRAARKLRPGRRTDMAPYHVMLATGKGQLALFQRFGLETLEYDVTEVSWPAPARVAMKNVLNPRTTGLFLLRRCSQAFSLLRPDRLGNRYFYVGRKRA